MPDRVDAHVHPVQVALRDPPPYRVVVMPIAISCRRLTTPCCFAAILASLASGCALKISAPSDRFLLHTRSVAARVLRGGALCDLSADE